MLQAQDPAFGSRETALKTSYPPEWDKQSESWDRGINSPDWPHYHYYHTFNLLLDTLIRPGRRVLELGCGTGETMLDIAPSVDEIFASDFSRQMIHKARSKLRAFPNGTRVHLAISDAQHIPARAATFDGAFSRGALLNYVPNPMKMLAEIYRVLVPEGKLILDMITRKPGAEAKLYPPTQVETMLKDSGFIEITFRPIGMFVNLWRNRELMNFVNKHRDIFSRIEIEINDAFKLDRSPMTVITARKKGTSQNLNFAANKPRK